MRLIDANIFEEIFKRDFCYDCNSYNEVRCRTCQRACLVNDVLLELDDIQTVDAIPVIHGDMEQLEKITIKVPHCRCSACNKLVVGWKSEINFCPNCGARMDGVE